MDIKQLKEHLLNNTDYVEELLENYFYNVKYYENSEQWRFGFTEDCNPNSIRLSAKNLSYKDYKFNEKGDIFSLIMRKFNINLGKCLDLISNKSNYEEVKIKRKEIYGGFFKKINKSNFDDLFVYDTIEIDKYPEIISKFFLKEDITIKAQRKFNIRYDFEGNRVVIPVYLKGKLIGAIGRYNLKDSGNVAKYLPLLRYPKNKVVFGYDINYSNILNNKVYIVESEKTVIKAYGEGFKNLLAIGGNSISERQKELIYSLNPSEIILVFDKGLGKDRADELKLNKNYYMESLLVNELEKLKSDNIYLDSKLGYINCNNIEEIKNKDNVFDLDYKIIPKYLNEITYI